MDQGSREKSIPSGPHDFILFGIFASFDSFPDYLSFTADVSIAISGKEIITEGIEMSMGFLENTCWLCKKLLKKR